MEVNYNDERFKEVETDKKAALQEVENTYGGMINDSDSYYKAQIDASKEWQKQQTQLQNEKTDFAIEQIEQQKDQAKKDYTKEQSGAYVDWQKQKNDYGTEAEKMAEAGLASTGFAESSQVSFYNTYQNRVMTAREAYGRAVLNYDNAIKDARLQNNSALAEIAYNALQKQLELSLAGFQYKNQLLLDKFDKRTQTEDRYHQRYQEVLSQINTENALSEQIRQFNEQMALEREQFEWQKAKASGGGSGGGGGGGGGGGDDNRISKTESGSSANSAVQKEVQRRMESANKNSSDSGGKVHYSNDIPVMSSAKHVANLVNSGSHQAVVDDKTGDTYIVKTPSNLLGISDARANQYLKSGVYANQYLADNVAGVKKSQIKSETTTAKQKKNTNKKNYGKF